MQSQWRRSSKNILTVSFIPPPIQLSLPQAFRLKSFVRLFFHRLLHTPTQDLLPIDKLVIRRNICWQTETAVCLLFIQLNNNVTSLSNEKKTLRWPLFISQPYHCTCRVSPAPDLRVFACQTVLCGRELHGDRNTSPSNHAALYSVAYQLIAPTVLFFLAYNLN